MTRLKRAKELPSPHKDDVRFGTPKEVAEYRAWRLCTGVDTVIEVGAGAGFQTAAFAQRVSRVIAIDVDADRLGRGVFPPNATVIAGDALDPTVIAQARAAAQGRTIVFLDPERPAHASQRTIGEIRPDIPAFIEAYGAITPDIAIELPPFLEDIPFPCEREYLSVDGELNRLTIYLGALRRCDVSVVALPGRARIQHDGPIPAPRSGKVNGTYILVADKALVRAGLQGVVLPAVKPIPGGYLADAKARCCTAYHVIAKGTPTQLKVKLIRFGKVILHGKMEPGAQRILAKELSHACGKGPTAHVFLGPSTYLTTRE